MGSDFKNDYYIFDRIDMRNLIASKNICKPEWGEKNCIYSYNKFYYFLSGEGTIIINDDIFTPKPEEFYFIPANTKHSFSHNPKKPFHKYWSHFDLTLNNNRAFTYSRETLKCTIAQEVVTPSFNKLVNLDQSLNPLNALIEKAALLELLKIFLEHIGIEKILQIPTGDLENKIALYIKTHIHEPITLTQLADIAHLHPNYFIKYFKKHFSMTPIDYINTIKLYRAVHLLVYNPEKSIETVAYETGFNDYRYFSRLFKKKYGVTPSVYKETKDISHLSETQKS